MNEDRFFQAVTELDGRYYEEAERYQAKRRPRLRTVLLAAAVCVCLLGAAALAAGGGTQLIAAFSGRRAPDTDFVESGYDLSADLEKLPESALSDDVLETGAVIRQQIQDHQPYDSRTPELWQKTFDTRAEACAFTGIDRLCQPAFPPECGGETVLTVYGNAKGQILSLMLESDGQAGDVRFQQFAQVYTEPDSSAHTVSVRTGGDTAFSESFYTAAGGRSCHIITSAAETPGITCMDGYLVARGVLYTLHAACPDQAAAEAQALIEQWADSFNAQE